jgi:hypothetical protein
MKPAHYSAVIPAQAGIQKKMNTAKQAKTGCPAMRAYFYQLDSRLRGNDGVL